MPEDPIRYIQAVIRSGYNYKNEARMRDRDGRSPGGQSFDGNAHVKLKIRVRPVWQARQRKCIILRRPRALMSHSSWMISDDIALTSGSQVNIFRINFRNISFSSPGGIVVTKSSKEVLGIGGSDIQLPIVIECQVHLAQSSD